MSKGGSSHIARALRGENPAGTPSLARGFRLGEWLVRPDLCLLEAGELRIQLEPKTMGVLLCLAEHAPQVVTREQFIEAVWDGRIVTDEVLSRAISLLRSELEDDAQDPRYIRTVPRVGYALLVPVEPLAADMAEDAAPRRRRGWFWIFAAAGVAALAVLSWWLLARDEPVAAAARLAVLPLASPGGQADASLAEGLTDELTTSLARVPGLRVVARNSALKFRSDTADLAEAAGALGATHLLTGSLRSSGERLRLNVRLADASTETEIWAESYERDDDALFDVQADIARAVAGSLQGRRAGRLGPTGSANLPLDSPPASPETYRLYLQGRQQMARRGEENLEAAIGLLKRAVAADPGFLRARFALAWASTLLANASPAHSEAAAILVDRELASVSRETTTSWETHAARAWREMERNDWVAAETAFAAALAAAPHETELRLLHSQMRGALGDADAASAEAHAALMDDPLSPAATLRVAVVRLWADDEAEAARNYAEAQEQGLSPNASPELPMLLYLRRGRMDQLGKALQAVQQRRGQSEDWVRPVISAIGAPARGAAAEAALERAAAAGQVDALLHFGALVLTGRNERALQWLLARPRLRTRELEFTLRAREAAGLRRLPGFGEVATRFGLDAYWDQFGWPAACARLEVTITCH